MNRMTWSLALVCIFLLPGCSSLMHPKADTFYHQAKGDSGKQTAFNLLDMMDRSAQKAKNEIGDSLGLFPILAILLIGGSLGGIIAMHFYAAMTGVPTETSADSRAFPL